MIQLSKYDERINLEEEYKRLEKEKSIFLDFLYYRQYPNEPGANLKKTYNYLQKIAVMENLHGDIGREGNREILFKYFNGYQFESEDAVKQLIYAFIGKEPVLALKYCRMRSLLDDFNGYYDFNAHLDDDLTMTIKDEKVIEVKPFEDFFKYDI